MRALLLVAVVVCGCGSATGVTQVTPTTTGPCPVTTPPAVAVTPPPAAGVGPNPDIVFRAGAFEFLYGNDALVVSLPADGVLHPSDRSRGLAGGVKFAWYRQVDGELVVATKRIDTSTAPQAANVPAGYGPRGFQPSGLNFAAPGCWQISGTMGDTILVFVVNIAAQ